MYLYTHPSLFICMACLTGRGACINTPLPVSLSPCKMPPHTVLEGLTGRGCSDVASGTFKDITVGPHGESLDMAASCNLSNWS